MAKTISSKARKTLSENGVSASKASRKNRRNRKLEDKRTKAYR